jgi:hypothetical protein
MRVLVCLPPHSRVPGADVPGALASKLGRGEEFQKRSRMFCLIIRTLQNECLKGVKQRDLSDVYLGFVTVHHAVE